MSRFGIRVDKQYFNFAAAHFLLFPDGTREELHGHNYHVSVEVEGEVGAGEVVLDFIPFKPIVKRCCDALDHRVVLPDASPVLEVAVEGEEVVARHGEDRFVFPRRDVVLLPAGNTSSEEFARVLAHRIALAAEEELPEARLERIRVWVEESPGQAAFCELDLPLERAALQRYALSGTR